MLRSIRRDGEALVTKLRATAQPERSSERASPDHRIRAGRRLLPMLVAQIHMQGAIWIDVAFASTFGVGFLSILEYGQRLTNMAPSILSNSLLSISYTELSHKAVEHKAAELNRETAWTFRTQLFLTLPVGLFLGTTAELIVSILLHRGAFSADAAQATTEVIRWLVPALVVNTMASTLNAAVFADPMLPHLKIFSAAAVAGLISRILLFVMLCGPMGINAIPFGTALSMAILSLVLLVSITRYRGRIFRAEDLWSVAGICFCGAVSSIVMLGVKRWLGTGLEASLTVELGALTIIGIAGAGSYLATAYLMKQHELGVLGMTPRRAA
jgi:putative peptidoglycan lipid II flippase